MRDKTYRRAQVERIVQKHRRDVRILDTRMGIAGDEVSFENSRRIGGKAKGHPLYCGCNVCQSNVDGTTSRQSHKRERQQARRIIAEQLS